MLVEFVMVLFSELDHDTCPTAFFTSRLLLKQMKWIRRKWQWRRLVQTSRDLSDGSVLWKRSFHLVNGGWDSIRQERSLGVSSNVSVGDPWLLGCLCCGGKYLFKFIFLCGCIALNVLIAWVQFSHVSLVHQDHAVSVKICVVSWLLLSSF